MKETLPYSTIVRAVLIDEDGVIVDERETTNFLTEFGEAWAADRLSDQGQAAMSHMAVGTGTGRTRASTELAIQTSSRVSVTPTRGTGADDNDVIAIGTIPATAPYAALLSEGGLFNHASNAQMLNYWNFSPPINKSASQTLVITVQITCGYS